MKSLIPAAVVGLMLAASSASFAESTPEYHVTRTVALGAPDRWDYVIFDPASARVYVAHSDEVTVVDGKSGDIVGHVKGLPGGTHGVALVTSLGIGFTDDGEAGQAASFDLKSLSVKTRIKAAEDADAGTGRIYLAAADVDPTTTGQKRPAIVPGSLKLLILDPAR